MKLTAPILLAVACTFGFSLNSVQALENLTVTVQDTVITGPTSFFNVTVTNNSASPISINDTTARVFQSPVNANLIFGTPAATTTVTPIHAIGFFDHNGIIPNTASDVSDNYSSGTVDTLAPGQTSGLMKVPVTVLNGFQGPVFVSINTDENVGTTLLNAAGDAFLPYNAVGGTLTVIPEPASLLLLGLVAPMLLRRRRRSST